MAWPASRSKYGNRKTTTADGVFDSKRELARWEELRLLEMAGQIRGLERQKRWPLYAGRPSGVVPVQVAVYVADFDYEEGWLDERLGPQGAEIDSGWEHVTEDCKGVRTAVYRLKAKMFLACYERAIRET